MAAGKAKIVVAIHVQLNYLLHPEEVAGIRFYFSACDQSYPTLQ